VEERPHRGLDLAVRAGTTQRRRSGGVLERLSNERTLLGGLIHEYRWAA